MAWTAHLSVCEGSTQFLLLDNLSVANCGNVISQFAVPTARNTTSPPQHHQSKLVLQQEMMRTLMGLWQECDNVIKDYSTHNLITVQCVSWQTTARKCFVSWNASAPVSGLSTKEVRKVEQDLALQVIYSARGLSVMTEHMTSTCLHTCLATGAANQLLLCFPTNGSLSWLFVHFYCMLFLLQFGIIL